MGGAFKISKNLTNIFRNKIFSTPVSEAGMVGIGNGLTLNGFNVVIEIMFGDFITLCTDQIVNHSIKFSDMYNLLDKKSLILRTPMGGNRGYGPTHSQSLEKILINFKIGPRNSNVESFLIEYGFIKKKNNNTIASFEKNIGKLKSNKIENLDIKIKKSD